MSKFGKAFTKVSRDRFLFRMIIYDRLPQSELSMNALLNSCL